MFYAYIKYFFDLGYYTFLRLIRVIIAFVDQYLFGKLNMPINNLNKSSNLASDINIFVPGLFGYTKKELKNIPYWNSIKYSAVYPNILTPKVGPINNFTDRACELFCSLHGLTQFYIRKESDPSKPILEPLDKVVKTTQTDNKTVTDVKKNKYVYIEIPARTNTAMINIKKILNNEQKINFITHSNGGFTLVRMLDLIQKGYFDHIEIKTDLKYPKYNDLITYSDLYTQLYNNHQIKSINMICGGVHDKFDNYEDFIKCKNFVDVIKFAIYTIVSYVLFFLQSLPISIKSLIYDPFFDIYVKNWSDFFKALISPMTFFANTQILEVGNGFPIGKVDVINVLKSTKAELNIYGGYYSSKIENVELIKSNSNPLLMAFSQPFSLSRNVSDPHDGIVPVKCLLGMNKFNSDDLKKLDANTRMPKHKENQIEYDLTGFVDKELKDYTVNNKQMFNIRIFDIDHLDVLNIVDDVYMDNIIWNSILETINKTD